MNFIGEHSGVWKDVYGILSKGQSGPTGDGIGRHSVDDIVRVQGLLHNQILANRVAAGERFLSLEEARKQAIDTTGARLKAPTGDGFFNPMIGVGTISDPQMYNQANIPISVSPYEATSLYASGGLPAIIVDKKSEGVLINGIGFKSYNEFWTDERRKQLEERAYSTGLTSKMLEAIRDATIYGGSALYPVLKDDNWASFDLPMDELLARGLVDKDKVARWVYADRWNMVFVPNYNITAEDYLFAKRYYIPISGISVNTERSAIIRPKQLPYWGAIRQLGWGVSDYEGYMRSVYAYEILIMSIPIMAQQMSLLLYQLPLDALIASLGVDKVEKLMDINEKRMAEWSLLKPQAVNMIGEVFTVNRTFSGFEHFVGAVRADVSAQSEIPEPVLFHTPSKGFSDNTTESLLKESETIRHRQRRIEPTLQPLLKILIADTWGANSEEYSHSDEIYFSFDKPIVGTETEMAEVGARFAASVNSLKQAGVPTGDAVRMMMVFFKSAEVSNESMDNIEAQQELENENAKKELEAKTADPLGAGSKGSGTKAPQQHPN